MTTAKDPVGDTLDLTGVRAMDETLAREGRRPVLGAAQGGFPVGAGGNVKEWH